MKFLRILDRRYHVILFTLIYLLIAANYAWRLENWEFVFYVFVVFFLSLIVLVIHSRVRFSSGVLWTLSVWGLFHLLGGLINVPLSWPVEEGTKHVLYNWWIIPPHYLKYDHVMHIYGFGIATWVCWQVLRPMLEVEKPTPSILSIAVLASMGLGACNEIIEFFGVMFLEETNVGGYFNTAWDLVSNLVGAVGAAVIIAVGKPIRMPKK